MNALQPWHWIVLVVVVVVLFGAKRLPDAARSVGKSMKIFKAETKGLKDENQQHSATDTTVTDVEKRQLPTAAPAVSPQDQQIAALQHQLDELKKQTSASPDSAPKNAG